MAEVHEDAVALTACGWVTPFAVGGITEVLSAGPSAELQKDENGTYSAVSGLDDTVSGLSTEVKRDHGALMAAVALELARRGAKLTAEDYSAERTGLVLGVALAGQMGMIKFAEEVRQQTARFVTPIHFPQTVGNYISGALARAYGIRGPNSTIAGGVASGLDAIKEAARLLADGEADVVLAGGVEQLSEELAAGLAQPGTRLSEGVCLFVLERTRHVQNRGGTILATLAGDEDADKAVIHATAGFVEDGAIAIGQWVGDCLGALSAAAVAASIGAAEGARVPFAKSAGAFEVKAVTGDDGAVATPGVVSANGLGDSRSSLFLVI